ncbi:MAG: response regulator [Sulfitobacter sp.]
MRILAVDDDPIILDLLERALTRNGEHQLTLCGSAEEALQLVKAAEHPFECALLDIMLPGIDGIDFCEVLRCQKGYQATPILMITASREVGLMRRAFFAGATDFVTKPFNGIELGARIRTAGMLNDSLKREAQAKTTLAELSESMKIGFSEQLDLKVPGLTNATELENWILRLQEGCHAINLFCIDVEGLRGIHSAVKPAQFRHALEILARSAETAVSERAGRLAYAGSGKFIGLTLGRTRLKHDALLQSINSEVSRNWDVSITGVPMPPRLTVKPICDERILSGRSASERLRSHLYGEKTSFGGKTTEQEARLFEKLNATMQ